MSDEHRYRWLFRKSPALMHSIDVEGRYVDLSDAWLERLGYEREEVIGRRPQDLNTPTSAQRITDENREGNGRARADGCKERGGRRLPGERHR